MISSALNPGKALPILSPNSYLLFSSELATTKQFTWTNGILAVFIDYP